MADDVQKIAQRIELTGEKEYNAALKEARQNLRVLQSQLKAETAELGKNATAQEKAEVKTKNLQKQIKEQEKVVKAYEKALAASTEKYGENSEAVAKWEIKLNDARTALANMRNGLNDVSEGMKQVQSSSQLGVVAANSLADSLGKIAEVGSSISGAIESSFSSLLGIVKDNIAMVWESVVDLAARSNNLVDMAGFWNTSATNIQKWGKAAAAASGTLSDMNDLVTKIVAKSNSDKKTGGILANVSPEAYEDQWEFAMAVMDSLSQMEGKERMAAATDIFGKSFTKALDFVNDWDKIKAALNENDAEQGGYGLTEEQINRMSDLYDQVNRLKESWQSLKDMATVSLFGDLAINVTGNIQNVLDAFRDYFNAETEDEKAAALAKVKENILEAFQNVKTAIEEGIEMLSGLAEELKNSDDSLAQALGTALEGLVNALKWLTDESNWDTIKTAIEGLIGLWAAGKIASALTNIASFAANIKTITAFKGGVDLAGFANAGASAGASFGASFAAALAEAVPWLAGLYTLLNPAETKDDSMEATYGEGWISDSKGDLVKVSKEEYDRIMADAEQAGQFMKEQEERQKQIDQMGQTYVEGFGPSSPVKRARLNASEDQQAAANAWWDIFRSGNWGENDQALDNAWNAMAEAFGGEDSALFGRLNTLLDRLIEEQSAAENDTDYNPDLWSDIPSTWWQNPSGQNNGITSSDLQGFRSLPGQVSSAVSRGISGIKVTLDGQTVGNLVAPYVSNYIAASMFE